LHQTRAIALNCHAMLLLDEIKWEVEELKASKSIEDFESLQDGRNQINIAVYFDHFFKSDTKSSWTPRSDRKVGSHFKLHLELQYKHLSNKNKIAARKERVCLCVLQNLNDTTRTNLSC
jgi:hypothetical protein